MPRSTHSSSPTVLLRVSDRGFHTHRSFNDFRSAVRSAEAYAKAGFAVTLMSATGRFLMRFDAQARRSPA